MHYGNGLLFYFIFIVFIILYFLYPFLAFMESVFLFFIKVFLFHSIKHFLGSIFIPPHRCALP